MDRDTTPRKKEKLGQFPDAVPARADSSGNPALACKALAHPWLAGAMRRKHSMGANINGGHVARFWEQIGKEKATVKGRVTWALQLQSRKAK